MIRKYGYASLDEAKEAANKLFWEYRDTTKESLKTMHETQTDRNGEDLGVSYEVDKDTGATACYFRMPNEEETYRLTFLTAEEADPKNRLYTCRSVKQEMLPFISSVLNRQVFRPVTPIAIAEAMTKKSREVINTYFGDSDDGLFTTTQQDIEERTYTKEDAIEEWENEDGTPDYEVVFSPTPELLTELTGVKVKKASDYSKGIAKLLGTSLTKEESKAFEKHYLFNLSFMFLQYATYEFNRTEDYTHLKDIIGKAKAFGLPNDWVEKHSICRGIPPEEYIVARYLNTDPSFMVGSLNVKEIAEYTGTPLPVIYRAKRTKYTFEF